MLNRTALLGLLVAAVLIGGCGRQFTRARFDMIQVGVDNREDVSRILGRPTTTFSNSDQWFFENQKKHYSALVHFNSEGRVAGKEWMDARTGEWSGQNPHAMPPPGGNSQTSTKTTRIDD